jgi:RNA polymerase sigma-70 factor (ECF subfamily)
MNKTDDNISEVNTDFYNKYDAHIRAIVTRILYNAGQSGDIDDCVNTVYLQLLEKLQQYNEIRGSMAAFITVITRSAALNYCRDNKRKIHELIGDKIDFIREPLNFENEIEFNMLVENILGKLNAKERALFTMRFILFDTPEDIAKTLKITRNAVDVRLNRMKNKIKKFLKNGGVI